MILLRYLYVLALVTWLGGTLALGGLAAPSIIAAIERQDAAAAPALASLIVADIFRRVHLVGILCGLVMWAALIGMRLLGPKPVQFNARFSIVFVMFAIAVYSGLVLPAQRVSFERLQDLPAALMIVTVAGGLSLLYWEALE